MGSKLPLLSNSLDLRLAAFLSTLLLLGGVVSDCVFAQAGGADAKAAAAGAIAGSYTEDPIDPNQRTKLSNIGAILIAGAFDATQQNDFDTYYKTYALPRWTLKSSLSNLNKYRQELINNLRQARTGQVHDYLNNLVLDYMNKLVKSDKYHPAVRFNAMLMIGELNSVDGNPPTPLESVLPILLAAVNDPNQIVPLKVAALTGINRHVTLGVKNPQSQNQILATMLKIAAVADTADGSDAGQVWMRKQAAEILGSLGSLGNNNQVVQVLLGIIGDAKASFLTRSKAAEALGKLKFAGAGGLNALDLAKPLCQLMCDACSAELSSSKETKLSSEDHRRNLKTPLAPVMDCLKALKPLAKNQTQQTALTNLQKIFDDLFKDLDNAKIESEELKKSVENCQSKLTDWLKK